jgi:hypothetical protein
MTSNGMLVAKDSRSISLCKALTIEIRRNIVHKAVMRFFSATNYDFQVFFTNRITERSGRAQ